MVMMVVVMVMMGMSGLDDHLRAGRDRSGEEHREGTEREQVFCDVEVHKQSPW
jgi:hypothetical protein